MKLLLSVLMSIVLTACAASPKQFSATASQLSDTRTCKTWFTALKGSDTEFQRATSDEIDRRGLGSDRCNQLIRQQRIAIGAALVVVAAAVAAANSSGGGGSTQGTTDYAWDWDQFRNEYGQTVTRCRGVQTGQFAEDRHCAGKYVNDNRWPGLLYR